MPLYEKMQGRIGVHPPAPTPEESSGPSALATSLETFGSWLSPGRVVRLPVGYLLLSVAGVLILVILTYMLAYSSGKRAGLAEAGGEFMANAGIADDPLNTDPDLIRLPDPSNGEGSLVGGGNSGARHGSSASRSNWGAIRSDPRKKGLNYFVLVYTRQEGGERLAKFCRENGLESYVVSCDDEESRKKGFRWVIVLPGFEASNQASPEIQALEATIRAVGRKWKAQSKANTDLSDFFAVKFE